MPFSDLNPESQQFLLKYFAAGKKLQQDASAEAEGANGESQGDALAQWQDAHAAMATKLQKIPAENGWEAFAVDLAKIETAVGDGDAAKAAGGLRALELLQAKIDNAAQAYHEQAKREAEAAIAEMKTYHGVARQLPLYESRLKEIDDAISTSPADFAGLIAAHKFIVGGKTDLKQISDAFRADYDDAIRHIKEKAEDNLHLITDPIVATEREAAEKMIEEAHEKLEEHSNVLAKSIATHAGYAIWAAEKIVRNKNDYIVVKQAAMAEVQKLEAALNPGAEAEMPLIKADVALADQYEKDRDYFNATRIMEPMPDRIKPLFDLCAGYEQFETSLDAANKALGILKKHHLAEYVQADILAAESFVVSCINLAANFKYAEAKTRLDTVPERCADLQNEAEGAAPFAQLLNNAADGDLDTLLTQAKDRLRLLRSHENKDEVDQAIADLSGFIDDAEKAIGDNKEAEARAALTQAASLASLTFKLAEAINQIYTRADALTEGMRLIASNHPQANYLIDKLGEVSDLADEARQLALDGDDHALATLENGEAQLDAAKRLGDAEETFHTKLVEVQKAANALATTEYPNKAKIAPQIPEHLQKAEQHSTAYDHINAMKELHIAEALVTSAELSKKAMADQSLDRNDIDELLKMPQGKSLLDEMVRNLPPDASQNLLLNLLEARFDMTAMVTPTDAHREAGQAFTEAYLKTQSAPILRQYYEVLASVPQTHVELNPSLARFEQVEEDATSFYEDYSGKIVMACKPIFNQKSYDLGHPDELQNIEADCVCNPEEPGKEVTWGTWTTMHEIGHAVDDRKRFMNSHLNNTDYGGWREHGGNTAQISAEVEEEFKFDAYYIERRMAGGNPDVPPPPDGVDQGVWDARKDAFEEWLADVGQDGDSNIWDSHTRSAQRKLKSGRMIHQAYKDTWVSYDFAARTKGVSGYQFRAPGEWFAELYAAFHTKRLNKSHPAIKWLAGL